MCDGSGVQPHPVPAQEWIAKRLVLDIRRLPDGRFEGTIHAPEDDRPAAFSGTLELLKALEESLAGAPVVDES
jgi:hypothetical protein